MESVKIDIYELAGYINKAFENDNEIFQYYDRNIRVKTIEDVCWNVFEKIYFLPEPKTLMGVLNEDKKIGYFVYSPDLLISFCLNKEYRNKENLIKFFELIKKELGQQFNCTLFDYNTRAIEWLKKMGMNVLINNLTVLKLCQPQH